VLFSMRRLIIMFSAINPSMQTLAHHTSMNAFKTYTSWAVVGI
jgi:hypothetical protein